MDLTKEHVISRSGEPSLHPYRDHDNHLQSHVFSLSDDLGTAKILLIRESSRTVPTGLARFSHWRIRPARRG